MTTTSWVTVLRCQQGHQAAKTFQPGPDGPDGRPVKLSSYDAGAFFSVERAPVDGLPSLSALLTQLEGSPDRLVIRGEPRDFVDLTRTRRLSAGDRATFSDAPLPWLMLDLDSVPVPPGLPLEAVPAYVVGLLPEYLAGASYHFQLSASTLGPGPTVSVHLWFWLDWAPTSEQLHTWALAVNATQRHPKIDPHVFQPVQPHFTARPVFLGGATDPLAPHVRSGLVRQGSDVVLFPQPPPAEDSDPEGLFSDRYRRIVATLGDAPRTGRGFHGPSRDAIACFIRQGGTDLAALKKDIKRRILAAPAINRPTGQVDQYASDAVLDDLITSAQKKYSPVGVPDLFTDEQIAQWDRHPAVPLPRRLVLLRGTSRYVWTAPTDMSAAPTYTLHTTSDVMPAILAKLARIPGIRWIDAQTARPRSLPDLEREHGWTLGADTIYDVRCTATTLELAPDGLSWRLRTAPSPMRPDLVPRFSHAWDDWINATTRPDVLRAFLSDFPRLDLPLFALILTGPEGTGKTVFGTCLAQLWGRPYTDASVLFPADSRSVIWSRPLLDCPYLFAPEGLPGIQASRLRKYLGEGQHTISQKYHPDAVLEGYPRLVIAANPDNAGLRLDDAGPDEITASAVRLQRVATTAANHPRSGQRGAFDWASMGGDALAEHTLWLSQNHPRVVDQQGQRPRFGLPPDTAFSRDLALDAKVPSLVQQWFWLALREPANVEALKGPVLLLPDGTRAHLMGTSTPGWLMVNASDVHASWGDVRQAPLRPDLTALRSALRALTVPAGPGHVLPRQRVVDWCSAMGTSAPSILEKML